MATWLGAQHCIDVQAEAVAALVSCVVICIIYIYLRARRVFLGRIATVLTMGCLLVVLTAWMAGNRMFRYWMVKKVPVTTWQQMATNILDYATKNTDKGGFTLLAKDLPQTFDVLGGKPAFFSSGGTWLPENDYFGVSVLFGGAVRRWGFVAGSDSYLDSFFQDNRWRGFEKRRVATNAVFFVGLDR